MSAIAIPDALPDASHIPAARHVQSNTPLARALAGARAVGVPAWAVAAEAGISPALLSMIARGSARVTNENARAIARALGRPVGELFPGLTRSVRSEGAEF